MAIHDSDREPQPLSSINTLWERADACFVIVCCKDGDKTVTFHCIIDKYDVLICWIDQIKERKPYCTSRNVCSDLLCRYKYYLHCKKSSTVKNKMRHFLHSIVKRRCLELPPSCCHWLFWSSLESNDFFILRVKNCCHILRNRTYHRALGWVCKLEV